MTVETILDKTFRRQIPRQFLHKPRSPFFGSSFSSATSHSSYITPPLSAVASQFGSANNDDGIDDCGDVDDGDGDVDDNDNAGSMVV